MKSQEVVQQKPSKLRNFAVMLFSSVMGLSGLTLMYLRATTVLHYPQIIGEILAGVTILVFALVSITFLIKCIVHRDAVLEELRHQVKSVFFGAIAVSFLLIATILGNLDLPGASVIWWIGAILELFVTCYCFSFWMNNDMQLQHATPAWMIPIVGNLIAPFGGVGIVPIPVLMFFFSVGIFFWIILLPILINRIIFHGPIAEQFIPTLFILIAPPAASLIAYLNINGNQLDFFGTMLFNIALIFTILIFSMCRSFLGKKFYISAWAYTFPLTAMAVATLVMFAQTGFVFYAYLAQVMIVVSTIIIVWVFYQTLIRVFNGKLFSLPQG
ncbi:MULTISPECIES: SLAC1 anion channel family protein [Shewanella]|nr:MULTISPECIES: SLAC1 anion channel family protein [Shewanella]